MKRVIPPCKTHFEKCVITSLMKYSLNLCRTIISFQSNFDNLTISDSIHFDSLENLLKGMTVGRLNNTYYVDYDDMSCSILKTCHVTTRIDL